MNPFTHAHNFETPGFHKCNVVMCHEVLRSADQSPPQNDLDAILYTRRTGRVLLQHSVGDKTQIVAGTVFL
jgi:hypothetical protein